MKQAEMYVTRYNGAQMFPGCEIIPEGKGLRVGHPRTPEATDPKPKTSAKMNDNC